MPAALLATAAIPVLFVLRRPSGLFAWVAGGALTLLFLWIFVSTLWPARADRTCPECGEEGLERLSESSTHGLRCTRCEWSDETVSAWLLAEEEGPLEETVLEERRRGRTRDRGLSKDARLEEV